MNYERFLQDVLNTGIVRDRESADAVVKAVLGILASRMTEDQARRLTENLPEPLTLEELRSHQNYVLNISPEEYTVTIMNQFSLDEDQARALIDTVLLATKDTVGKDMYEELKEHLPADWAKVFEEV